jgi:hypothetical protein
MQVNKMERSANHYLSMLRYLEHIRKSGKIHRLTRSQIKAIRSRLDRYLSTIRKYLKLATLDTSLYALHTINLDEQCRMNRLHISNHTSFLSKQNLPSSALVDIDNDRDFDLIVGNSIGRITYENRDRFFKRSYGFLNPFNDIDSVSLHNFFEQKTYQHEKTKHT